MPVTHTLKVEDDDSVSQSQPCGAREPISRAAPEAEPTAALLADLHRVGLALQQLSKQGEDYIWRPCDAALPVIERAMARIAADADLLAELRALVTAVTYVTPPTDFGTPDEPNPCFEARVPVEFVDRARAAIARASLAKQEG
jgi:hypothetical protein